DLSAIPALGKFTLYQPFNAPPVLHGSSTFAIETAQLDAAGVKLEKSNRVMLVSPVGGVNPYHQVAVIDKVEVRFEQTEITIKGAWLGPSSPTLIVYKLGRDFRHFGYNAPPTETVITNGTATQRAISYTRFGGFVVVAEFQSGYVYNPLSSNDR